MRAELNPAATDEKISELRKQLNQRYDIFGCVAAIEGLSLSLTMRGRLDMNYIWSLTGKNIPELERDLGATWIDPKYYVDFVEYLLGDDFVNGLFITTTENAENSSSYLTRQ